jgi:hypothetical protein
VKNINLSHFPSDPSAYEFSNHFKEDVIEDEGRHLKWDKTFGTIKHGKISEAEGQADIEWVRDYHGVKVYILAGYNSQKEVPVVVTGWPAVHDPRQAVSSGRWTEEQLREINEFNDGNGLEQDFIYP